MKKKYNNTLIRRTITIILCTLFLTASITSGFSFSIKQSDSRVIPQNIADQTNEKSTGELIQNKISTSIENNPSLTVESVGDITRVTCCISDFFQEKVCINDKEYYRIVLGDESNIVAKGMPDLPTICRSIIIPDVAEMNVRVIDAQFVEYNDVLVAPSKGILNRSINPDDVPYVFDRTYTTNAMFPGSIAKLDEPYILRDFRGQTLTIYPFQYNPHLQTLRFYTDISVEIFPIGVGKVNCIQRSEPVSAIDTDFTSTYIHHFLNFNPTRYPPVGEQGNMLVITYDDFWDEMLPFVQWKNMKGIPTEMVNVSAIGDATMIRQFIGEYYNDYGLTFVLLAGDAQQIPTLYASGCASDPSYAYVVGDDHYPDLFIGRFSALTDEQINTQVERSITYEKFPEPSVDWYNKGTGIASTEGPGDDGEYDHEHMEYIRNDLLAHTYTQVDQRYGSSTTSSQIASALNDGRGVVNYCGHGSTTSWSTSGFGNSHIDSLTNDHMLPFIWSVACYNGRFDTYDTCFAEAWLRAINNTEPTGAIAVFMSSAKQSWDPPMDAQDEIIDLLVKSYENNQKNTFGGLSFNGCMHMNDEYGSAGYAETDAWHVFGDPSLEVRTDAPENMNVTHDSFIFADSGSYELDVPGVSNALCAISYNYNLMGSGYTDQSGHAVINFDTSLDDVEAVDLVITAYNKIPYISTVKVIAKRQPAEFEPMQGALIRYPSGLSYEIIAELSEDVEVVTIVENVTEENYVASAYASHGVNVSRCSFLHAQTNTYWTRDYGPWFAFNESGECEVVDFDYNRPRPYDNAIPTAYAAANNLSIYNLDLIHTGGNYMTDGQGTAVSTDLIWTENLGLSHEQINEQVAVALGIHTYNVVPDVLDEYIQHIDCWAKFLAPDVIMILEVPEGHPQYDEIETAVDYFKHQESCYKTPYEIVRIYAPDGEPYTNSLILNDKVLVPLTGDIWDDDALETYQLAMPGYEILGFSGSWETTDALHCRVKGIPDSDMLYIEHIPLCDEFISGDGFAVEAWVISHSEENVIPESVQVFWRTGEGGWNASTMISLGCNRYQFFIPLQIAGETVYYYIHAEDYSGRSVNHPYIGAPGPHSFIALGNNPPCVPGDPDPDNFSTYVDIYMNLSWTGGDPNSDDNVTYDVYFGTTNPPQKVSDNQSTTTYDPGIMNYSTMYYWRVVAWDNHGVSTSGTIWQFETSCEMFSIDLPLLQGWNLITVPFEYEMMASDLAENITGCISVNKWDPVYHLYLPYIVGGPPGFDFTITQGIGLFVDVSENSTLNLSGRRIDSVNVPLKIGWNLIGWYHTYNTTASSLAENITGCVSINRWDAVEKTYKPYIVGGPPGLDFTITQGMGLFVDVSAEITWHGDG